ncbi:MAG: hypothetical protein LBL71_00960 [Endomicrobium sp.]|jgi:hypothetical protein|nr:hypothetical protein [Endomicrobium sp.]
MISLLLVLGLLLVPMREGLAAGEANHQQQQQQERIEVRVARWMGRITGATVMFGIFYYCARRVIRSR